jgi:hypothetical protein
LESSIDDEAIAQTNELIHRFTNPDDQNIWLKIVMKKLTLCKHSSAVKQQQQKRNRNQPARRQGNDHCFCHERARASGTAFRVNEKTLYASAKQLIRVRT